MINLEENLQPGKSIRKYLRKEYTYNRLMHILVVIENEAIMYKSWNFKSRAWYYGIETIPYLETMNSAGWLYLPGQKVVER